MYVCKHYVRAGGKLRFPGEVLEEGEAPEEALRRLLERGAIETVDGGEPSAASAAHSYAEEPEEEADGDPSGASATSPYAGEADEEDDGIADGIDPMAGIVGAGGKKRRRK